jgi:hypothetical protein
VTVSIAEKGKFKAIVAHCTARISADPKELDIVYSDEIKKYGYTGRDDARLRIIVLTIHSVVHQSEVYVGVPADPRRCDIDLAAPLPPLPSGPFNNKAAVEVIKKECGTGTGSKIKDCRLELMFGYVTLAISFSCFNFFPVCCIFNHSFDSPSTNVFPHSLIPPFSLIFVIVDGHLSRQEDMEGQSSCAIKEIRV